MNLTVKIFVVQCFFDLLVLFLILENRNRLQNLTSTIHRLQLVCLLQSNVTRFQVYTITQEHFQISLLTFIATFVVAFIQTFQNAMQISTKPAVPTLNPSHAIDIGNITAKNKNKSLGFLLILYVPQSGFRTLNEALPGHRFRNHEMP